MQDGRPQHSRTHDWLREEVEHRVGTSGVSLSESQAADAGGGKCSGRVEGGGRSFRGGRVLFFWCSGGLFGSTLSDASGVSE
jgi:hypothetical protein